MKRQSATDAADVLMTPGDVAKVLSVSADTVRAMADDGRLPSLRTLNGRRLFWRSDVERVATGEQPRRAPTLPRK